MAITIVPRTDMRAGASDDKVVVERVGTPAEGFFSVKRPII